MGRDFTEAFPSTVEVGKDLWMLSGPTSLLKAVSVSADCSGLCPLAFEYLQGWRFHNLSGQPLALFDHHYSGKKTKQFFKEIPLYFNFYLLPLVFSLVFTKKNLALLYLYPTIRYLWMLLRSRAHAHSLSLFLSNTKQLQLSHLVFVRQILHPKSSLWPFAGLAPLWLSLSSPGESRTGFYQCWQITFYNLLALCLPMKCRVILAAFATEKCCCLLMYASTRVSMSFPAKLLSSQLAHSLFWCMELFLPRCRISHFLLSFVKLPRVSASPIFSPVEVPLNHLMYQPALLIL